MSHEEPKRRVGDHPLLNSCDDIEREIRQKFEDAKGYRTLLAALKAHEWSAEDPYTFVPRCPICRLQQLQGHATDCWLAALMAEHFPNNVLR